MEKKEQVEIEKLELYYALCVEANFDSATLKRIATTRKLKITEIRDGTLKYMREYLKVPKDIINEHYMFFIHQGIKATLNKFKKMLNILINDGIISPESITDFDWLVNSLEETIRKYCYEIGENISWNHKEIEMIANSLDISWKTFVTKAEKYSHKYFNTTHKEWQELLRNKNVERNNKLKHGKYINIFDRLLQAENEQEIIATLSTIGTYPLKIALENYLKTRNQYEETKANLLKKISFYAEHKKQLQEKYNTFGNNNLQIAQEVITKYISSDNNSIELFCKELKINEDVFATYIEVIKLKDPDLYQMYLSKTKANSQTIHQTLLKDINLIMELIANGVNENGKVRPFDALDYYSMTKLNFSEFFSLAKNHLNTKQLVILKRFIQKNSEMKIINNNRIKVILDEITIFGAKVDDKGNIIATTGTEVTKEEKIAIIDYLEKQEIPLYNKVYRIALKRYINGELSLTEPKKRLLNKQ